MQEWQHHFKILSCQCGKYTIMDLVTCLSEPGKEKWGHFQTKENAERRIIDLYCGIIFEKDILDGSKEYKVNNTTKD